MRTDLHAPVALIYSFLLVATRMAGSLIFVPMPMARSAADPVRIVLVLMMTIAMYPFWPTLAHDPNLGEFCGWMAVEVAFGLGIGLIVSVLSEAAGMFGHLCGLHSGLAYASQVDPTTQADSPVLSIIAQTLASLLFVTLGLHRIVIAVFAQSLQTMPPGSVGMHAQWGELVIHALGTIFGVGLRLAFPVIALLLMVDITLALLTRINSGLQVMHLSTPLKTWAAIALIGAIIVLFPGIYSNYAASMLHFSAGITH